MRTIILICLALVISSLGVHSQSVTHLPETNERIISSKKIEYLNIEEGWAREKNVWYFHGNQIMVTPAIYTLIETIDSTFTSNEEKSKFRMEIREESSGNYKTSEEGWDWNGGVWTFKEDTVHSYERFHKHGHHDPPGIQSTFRGWRVLHETFRRETKCKEQ